MTRTHAVLTSAAVAGLLLSAAPWAGSQTMGEKLKLTAFAVNLNATRPGAATATVEISVGRWSTEAERRTMTTTLVDKGPEALVRALQRAPVAGRIRTPDTLGYDLRYAHEARGEDGGRQIVLITDRPIGYWEAVNRPRSIDYPFTVIELHLNEDGTGEGKMSFATKINAIGSDTIVLEDYALQPVMLQSVRVQP